MTNPINQYAGCKKLYLKRFNLRPLELDDDVAIFNLRSHPAIFKYVDIKIGRAHV